MKFLNWLSNQACYEELMKEYTSNYLAAGGTRSFSEYYTAKYDNVILRTELKKNVIFAQHNLATDGPFNEFNVIFCRNTMIYFNKTLQKRVYKLFHESLAMFGILGFGSSESLKFSSIEADYEALDARVRLYRRTT